MPTPKTVGFAAVLVTIFFVAGCNNGESFPVAPVSGTITLDGNPLPDATVTFEPTSKTDTGNAGELSVGNTTADGKFELKTISDQEGAVVGKHRVRITTAKWENADSNNDDPNQIQTTEELLPKKYNIETELTFEVPAGGTQAADFQLTSK